MHERLALRGPTATVEGSPQKHCCQMIAGGSVQRRAAAGDAAHAVHAGERGAPARARVWGRRSHANMHGPQAFCFSWTRPPFGALHAA